VVGDRGAERPRAAETDSVAQDPSLTSGPGALPRVTDDPLGAAAAPLRRANAAGPTAAQLQSLQRSAGNRAVSQLLCRPAKPSTGVPHRLLQRNGNSAALMEDLAKPKVFQLKPAALKDQDLVVAKLEEQLNRLSDTEQATYDVSFLGGIELTKPLTKEVRLSHLIKQAKLVDLPQRETLTAIPASTFPLAKKAHVEQEVVATTLRTMERAGQLDYLRTSGLIDDQWKIVIEVHYYRSRNPKQQSFHKDTAGRTLFVNLNYLNEAKMAGPEYIMNPEVPAGYEEHLRTRLPKVFAEDLKKAKLKHGKPTRIEATVIPPKGVVSFVDEALHHKTPTLEHRTASAGDLRFVLRQNRRDEFEDAEQAYRGYKAQALKRHYKLHLQSDATKQHAATWFKIMDAAADARFNRTQLAAFKPLLSDDEIEATVEVGGLRMFGTADFLFLAKMGFPKGVPVQGVEVKEKGKPPLKRKISEQLLGGEKLPPATSGSGRRTFFRTWVYAVPK
jgi:hypothetical protein